jgi:hypothetical protein
MIVWTGSKFVEWDDYAISERGLPECVREATYAELVLYRHGRDEIKRLRAALLQIAETPDHYTPHMVRTHARAALEGEKTND